MCASSNRFFMKENFSHGWQILDTGRILEELFQVDCNIVEGALRITLSQEISLDRLRLEFGNRIRSLSLSHPSLDDVFVDLKGQHLESPLSIGLGGSGD